jgi:hypothetical protein
MPIIWRVLFPSPVTGEIIRASIFSDEWSGEKKKKRRKKHDKNLKLDSPLFK